MKFQKSIGEPKHETGTGVTKEQAGSLVCNREGERIRPKPKGGSSFRTWKEGDKNDSFERRSTSLMGGVKRGALMREKNRLKMP